MLDRFKAPLFMILFVLTMSACSGESNSSEKSQPQAEAVAVETPSTTMDNPDELFLAKIHKASPGTKKAPDADMIRLAEEFCGFLDDGFTPQGVVASGVQSGGDASAVKQFLRIGVPIYCPQHTNAVEVNLS